MTAFHKYFLSVSLLLSVAVFGQTGTDSSLSSFQFSYANDLFNATDRYYTQGVLIELRAPFVKHSPLSHLLLPAETDAVNEYGLSLQQDVFTPYTILKEGVYKGERPYCATLYLSHHLMSWDWRKGTTLETKLDLGVIGPAAGGEQMQTAIHTALDNALPRGWKHQVSNDLLLNYTFIYEEAMLIKKHFVLLTGFQSRIGTVYDDAGISFGIKTGKVNSFFLPAAASGAHWQIFANMGATVVAYNATMQGGVFNRSSEYVLSGDEIERVVFHADAGIKVQIKRVEISYSNSYITAEFNHGLDHGWGVFGIAIKMRR
jgi:lipid A 3-O-deacylase